MEATIADLLIDALKLMVIGMTVVYGFLLLLVGILLGMSRWATRLAAGGAGQDEAAQVAAHSGTPGPGDPRLVAAITIAVERYRRRQRG